MSWIYDLWDYDDSSEDYYEYQRSMYYKEVCITKKEMGQKKDTTYHDPNLPDGTIRLRGYYLFKKKDEIREMVPKRLRGTDREEKWIKFHTEKVVTKCQKRDNTWSGKALRKKNTKRQKRRETKRRCKEAY